MLLLNARKLHGGNLERPSVCAPAEMSCQPLPGAQQRTLQINGSQKRIDGVSMIQGAHT